MIRSALVVALAACSPHASKLDEVKSTPRDAAVAAKRTLEQDLETLRAKLGVPALAAAMWRDGKLVEEGAVGVRKEGDPTKVTMKDQWHLGSNTKAMTATLVGIYVDRGKLKWDDTVGKLFAGWKIDPELAKVTVDQLMHHQGGLAHDAPDPVINQAFTDGDAPDARTKLVKAILAEKLDHAPGTFVYSNSGYVVLGAALERITGQRWEQLMKDELFAKLDMTSCGFGPPGSKATLDQPRGHDEGGTPIEPGPAADNPPAIGPAGTVHCSLDDYGKFLNMQTLGTPALVTAETMQHLHATDGNYAGGWIVMPGPAFGHSGSNTMWYVTAMITPSKKGAFVIATNKGTALDNDFGEIINRKR